jgi:hypothetical protein
MNNPNNPNDEFAPDQDFDTDLGFDDVQSNKGARIVDAHKNEA